MRWKVFLTVAGLLLAWIGVNHALSASDLGTEGLVVNLPDGLISPSSGNEEEWIEDEGQNPPQADQDEPQPTLGDQTVIARNASLGAATEANLKLLEAMYCKRAQEIYNQAEQHLRDTRGEGSRESYLLDLYRERLSIAGELGLRYGNFSGSASHMNAVRPIASDSYSILLAIRAVWMDTELVCDPVDLFPLIAAGNSVVINGEATRAKRIQAMEGYDNATTE